MEMKLLEKREVEEKIWGRLVRGRRTLKTGYCGKHHILRQLLIKDKGRKKKKNNI